MRMMSDSTEQSELQISSPEANCAEGLDETPRPAGRVWIWLGIVATAIGVVAGLVMSSVGS